VTDQQCGASHHRFPETLCIEPAGHYRPDRDPHAGPLIIDGRERGGAAWDEPKDTRMTDRPSLQDLDAVPEPARWCCNGNAEDCPLCDTASLPYPWICPGHPDTPANRARVAATHSMCTVTVQVHAPTEENASRWAETLRDHLAAEYGEEMHLDIAIGRPVKSCCGQQIGHFPFCPARQSVTP